MNAMYAVGVTARNVDEAEQAIDLAAKMMSYVLQRKIKAKEVRAKMVELIEADEAARAVKH